MPVPSFLVLLGSTISSSSPHKEESVSFVSDVAPSCSRDLNMLVYQGSASIVSSSAAVPLLVGASVSPSGNGNVGAMVGAIVVAQIGSEPSSNSGGWHDSNSGRHIQPISDSAHSSSVSYSPQLQLVVLSKSIIPTRLASSSSDIPSSFSSLANILLNGGRAP